MVLTPSGICTVPRRMISFPFSITRMTNIFLQVKSKTGKGDSGSKFLRLNCLNVLSASNGFPSIWTAIETESQLIVSWLVGGRDSGHAIEFMDDLRSRLANRVQPTTDGHKSYLEAVRRQRPSEAANPTVPGSHINRCLANQ